MGGNSRDDGEWLGMVGNGGEWWEMLVNGLGMVGNDAE